MSATERTVIAKIVKNKVETVHVALDRYGGVDLIDIRAFVIYGDQDEPRPSKKGISVKIALLPDLIAALKAAEEEAQRRGLLDDGGGS